MEQSKKSNAYKEAGVDIDAGAALVERIKPAVKATNRKGCMSGIGGFGAFFDPKAAGFKDPILVSATDGVGTKLKIAIDTGKHDTVGIDLVAMCVNDLIVQGAEPLFFLDYFATGKLDVEHATAVVNGIAKGCEISGCALIGGETAEMPGMYASEDYDLAGFTVGAVERDEVLDNSRITSGDVILGLASNGLHSNGFSLVRKIVAGTQGYDYSSDAPFAVTGGQSQNLGDILLTPTRIYVKSILTALKLKNANDAPAIKGIANITGGGLIENIPRVLPDNLTAIIDTSSWALPPLFKWLGEAGNLNAQDMGLTLNCGIGMVVICDAADAADIAASLEENGETVFTIGALKEKSDLNSDLEANANSVILENTEQNWPHH